MSFRAGGWRIDCCLSLGAALSPIGWMRLLGAAGLLALTVLLVLLVYLRRDLAPES